MRFQHVSALALGVVALALAGGAHADAVPRAPQERAFFEGLAFGETFEIVRNGPISVEAICEESVEIFTEEFADRIRLLAVTSVPGVVGDLGSGDFPDFEGNYLDPSTPEDERVMFSNTNFPPGAPDYDNDIDEGSLIAPSGEVIMIDGEILGLGLNVLGTDCLVAGTYLVFRGRL